MRVVNILPVDREQILFSSRRADENNVDTRKRASTRVTYF